MMGLNFSLGLLKHHLYSQCTQPWGKAVLNLQTESSGTLPNNYEMEVLLDSANFIERRGKKSISIWGWKDGVREKSFFNYKTALSSSLLCTYNTILIISLKRIKTYPHSASLPLLFPRADSKVWWLRIIPSPPAKDRAPPRSEMASITPFLLVNDIINCIMFLLQSLQPSLTSSKHHPILLLPDSHQASLSVPMLTAPQHALMLLTSCASAGNTFSFSWPSHSCSSSETPPKCLPHAHWIPELSPAQRCSQRTATKAQPTHTTMLLFPSCPHQPRTLRAGPLPVHVWVPAWQDIDWHSAYFGKYQGNWAECQRWFQFGKQTPQKI